MAAGRSDHRLVREGARRPRAPIVVIDIPPGGSGATIVALVLGSPAVLRRPSIPFFGRETISFIVILPIALPGIVTGIALNTAFRTIGFDLGL